MRKYFILATYPKSGAKLIRNKSNILKINMLMLLLFFTSPSYAITGIKTPPANINHLLAFRSAVEQVAIATTSTARSAALKTLSQQVLIVKSDMTAFYKGLVTNGDIIALDNLFKTNAPKIGGGC